MVAQVVIKLALTAASMALQATKRIEGPRVTDLKVTSGDYGAPWPRVWGTRWLRPPVIWAEDLKEVKQTRKTKGGKFNDYTYFGFWAHGLAIHELAAVRRVKADGHLIYDASGAGPVTPFTLGGSGGGKGTGAGGGSTIADYMRFVPGNFTQGPDPAILADVEAKHGEGSCPAYRGRALLVFDGVPLEKFGNRIPQIEVEVTGTAAPNYPFETRDTLSNALSHLYGATFSSDYSRLMWAQSSGSFEIWDVAARARMIGGTLPVGIVDQGPLGLYNSGQFLAVGTSHLNVYKFSADGASATAIYTSSFGGVNVGGVRVVADAAGAEHWCGLSYSSLTQFLFDGVVYDFPALTGVTFARVTDCFVDAGGSIWLAGSRAVTAGTTALFHRIVAAPGASGPGTVVVSGLPAAASVLQDVAAVHFAAPGSDQFVFAWGTAGLYAAARATGTVLYSNTAVLLDAYNTAAQFAGAAPGASSIWVGGLTAREVSLANLAVIRTPVLNNWTAQSADGILYDPLNHALITAPSTGNKVTWRYLDRIGATGVVLGDVVRDVAVLSGIDPAEIDVTALTQMVPGYDVAGGSGKDWIGPLCELYDIDPRPHGFVLEFLPRGAASDETIASTAFAAPGGAGPLFTATPENGATDLPRQVTMQFADLGIEQQPANAMSPPLFNGGSQRSQSLDMSSLALSAATARQLVARFARRQRFDARGYSLALPLARIDLEPGAVKVLDLAGVAVTARLQSMVLDADRRIATEWKADAPSVAVLDGAAGASADGQAPAAIVVPLLSKGFALDLPLLRDLDERASPVIYNLAAPYAAGPWPGARLLRLQGGEYSDEVAAIDSSAATSWGYATTALAAPASPWLWDRARVVNVKLQVGSLTGTTEAAIDAGGAVNLALLGGELIQFASATLEADGSHTLSGLKRGRRGTEWAVGSHAVGETFVLLGTADAAPLDLALVGTNQSFKAVTNGRTEAGAFPIALAPFSGASKKPYAPCRLTAVKDAASGDWALSWVRRTRIGGAWTSGTPIALGEASEAYAVEILNGAAVVRTITGLTSAAAVYTSAQQVADWGAAQTILSWRVYQLSDSVGRGFAAAA